jgi:hypothetical protein
MDWATVASTAITGAVGIVGVGGALLAAKISGSSTTEAARLGITGESDRARLAEKRRIYARAITALDAGILAGRWTEFASTAASDASTAASATITAERATNDALAAAADAFSAVADKATAEVGEAVNALTAAAAAASEATKAADEAVGKAAADAAARLNETSAAWKAALEAAILTVSELQLIAPPPVGALARQALESLTDRHFDAAARNKLIKDLRADLDEEARQSTLPE